jgi:peptidoglycan/LPS O-acetylase OafA/YrhL
VPQNRSRTNDAPLNSALLSRIGSRSHIPALDALRGVAACTVVYGHTLGYPQLGSMAVSVFFVLSGFLITWLLLRESEVTGKVSLRSFYLRRTLRIFPAFYVFWTICIAAAWFRYQPFSWAEALSSFFYLGDYYSALAPIGSHLVMGITWSLGVEEKFYLLWPVAFVLWHKDARKLLKFTVGFLVAIWLYRAIACLWLPLPQNYLHYAFESRLDTILFGCALALAFKQGKIEILLRAVDRIKILPLILAFLLVRLALLEGRVSLQIFYIFGFPLISILVAVMIIQFVFLGAMRGWNWLEHPVLRFLGRISYSLYLYQLLVIATVEFYLMPALRLRWAIPVMYVGSLAAAYASYRLVEMPFLRLKSRFETFAGADTEHRRPENILTAARGAPAA